MAKKKYRSPAVKQIRDKAKYCYYCLRELIQSKNKYSPLGKTEATIDHFIPLDREGSNSQYNLVICCYQCNTVKGNLLPGEFNKLINEMWQLNTCFKYSKQELRNIISQIKYIRSVYDDNMKANKPYYLMQLPRKLGLLEQLRLKYIQNEFPFSYYKHRQTAEC